MFTLVRKLRQLVFVEVTSTLRSYAATKDSRRFDRLPPGFGKMTSFGLYIKENFALRKNEKPKEVFINLTKQWKSLSEADKKKYVDESLRISEEKRSNFEMLSEAEKEKLFSHAQHLKEARLKRRIRLERRKKRGSDYMRPLSAWMLFVKEKAAKGAVASGVRQQDVFKEVAAAWKGLSNTEKNVYSERARKLSKCGKA